MITLYLASLKRTAFRFKSDARVAELVDASDLKSDWYLNASASSSLASGTPKSPVFRKLSRMQGFFVFILILTIVPYIIVRTYFGLSLSFMADRIHNLSEFIQQDNAREHFQQVKQAFRQRKYAAGDVLVRNREVCTELFFLGEGLIRCSNFEDNRTLWFEIANNFFAVPDSFMHQSPSHQELTCLEDSIIYTLKREKLQQLCKNDNNWANWWIQVLEREYLKLEYIYQTLIYKSASERYHELVSAIPDIENRIPLKYIASFLGISQVSLSRIRAGKQ